jgi:hypothetical protein
MFERSHSPAFRALEEQHHPQRETFLGEPGATQTSLRDAFGCGELINSGSAEVDPAPQRASVDSRRDTVESLEGSLGASDASQLVESTAAIGRVMCEGLDKQVSEADAAAAVEYSQHGVLANRAEDFVAACSWFEASQRM